MDGDGHIGNNRLESRNGLGPWADLGILSESVGVQITLAGNWGSRRGMEYTLTQKWLRQNIQPYPSKERVYSDTDAALSRYPSLRPKSDVYSS